jgi:tetratricopeptide (TPR) repeat protein
LAANALLAYLESTPERNAGSSEILVAVLQSSLDIYSRRAAFADGEHLLKRVGLLFPTPRPELLQAEMLLAEARLKFNDGTMMVTEKLRATSQGLSLEEARRAQARLVAEATDHVTRALPIYRAYRKTDKVIQALTTLGNCHRAAGRFQDAEAYYLQALHELDRELERERFKVDQRAAVLRANLALVKGRQGNYLDACKDLRDVVGQLVEPTDRIEAYAALALYEYLRGNAQDAQPWRTRADALKDALGQGEISLCREDEVWQQREVLSREVWRERMSGN